MKVSLALQKEITNYSSWELDTQLRFAQNAAFQYWSVFGLLASDHGDEELSEVIEAAKILREELENATEKATRLETELQLLQLEVAA
tara:strand:- start:1222 stop:1482 length:261 start_codon:yes stop_codon:yes gene_type:complete